MRALLRTIKIAAITTALSVSFTAISYAGQWKQDTTGSWWQEDNGSYPVNTWGWIDGNQDGVSECYYFDGNGYCLTNAVTPDGYQVNGDGAWAVNGVVQTQGQQSAASYKEKVVGTWEVDSEKTNAENDLSLQMMFGSGIKYGDELVLNEDGTASWYIGIGNGGSGTYVLDGSTVTLTYVDYEEQDQRVMTLRSLKEAGKSYIRMNYENYDLYWVKKQENTGRELLVEE